MSASGFTSPGWFLLLAAVGGLVAIYLWAQRVRRRNVLRFANLPLLERVMPQRPSRKRHLPFALLAVALTLLVVGLAGPTAEVRVPRNRATVMLVIDTSLSMQSTDVQPSRLGAAQDAATKFVRDLTPSINLGLESFSGTATVLVAPTTQREPVIQQIGSLKLSEATATGDAIASALNAIDTFNQLVPGDNGAPIPARIVLMSDGKQTGGRDEFAAARQAAQARIPISTISFGTTDGVVDIEGKPVPVPVDDESLAEVARLSGGEFFSARSNSDLHRVYDTLGEQIGYQTVRQDASRPWFMLGTLAALVAVGGALLLTQRLPA